MIALGKLYVLGTIDDPEVSNGDGPKWWDRVARNPRFDNYYRGMALYDLSVVTGHGYGTVPRDAARALNYQFQSQRMGFHPGRGPREECLEITSTDLDNDEIDEGGRDAQRAR